MANKYNTIQYNTIQELQQLDLQELGITAFGDIKDILKRTRSLKPPTPSSNIPNFIKRSP